MHNWFSVFFTCKLLSFLFHQFTHTAFFLCWPFLASTMLQCQPKMLQQSLQAVLHISGVQCVSGGRGCHFLFLFFQLWVTEVLLPFPLRWCPRQIFFIILSSYFLLSFKILDFFFLKRGCNFPGSNTSSRLCATCHSFNYLKRNQYIFKCTQLHYSCRYTQHSHYTFPPKILVKLRYIMRDGVLRMPQYPLLATCWQQHNHRNSDLKGPLEVI